jgi:hypothetical protein
MRKRQQSHRDRMTSLEANFWKYISYTFIVSATLGVIAGYMLGAVSWA